METLKGDLRGVQLGTECPKVSKSKFDKKIEKVSIFWIPYKFVKIYHWKLAKGEFWF